MKILTLLAVMLVCLAIPALVFAHGRGPDNGHARYRCHDACYYDSYQNQISHSGRRCNHPRKYANLRCEKKRLKHELRETRRELRQVNHQIHHNRQSCRYPSSCSSAPVVVVGIPSLVFMFDW